MDRRIRELISYGLTLEEAYKLCEEKRLCREEDFWRLMVGRTFPDLGFPIKRKGVYDWEKIYTYLVNFSRSQPYVSLEGNKEKYFQILNRNARLFESKNFFFFLPSKPISDGKELFFLLGAYKDNFTPQDLEDFYNIWVKARKDTLFNRSPQNRISFTEVYGKTPRFGILRGEEFS